MPEELHQAPALNQAVACLAVVIPVFNEATTIGRVIETVLGQPLVQEIIIVDDAS